MSTTTIEIDFNKNHQFDNTILNMQERVLALTSSMQGTIDGFAQLAASPAFKEIMHMTEEGLRERTSNDASRL